MSPKDDAAKTQRISKILVAVDPGEAAREVVEFATTLAEGIHAQLGLLCVADTGLGFSSELAEPLPRLLRQAEQEAARTVTEAARHVPADVTYEMFVTDGFPDRQIVDEAKRWGADLIVMGTHGHGRLARFVLGSTTEYVVRHAHCPVTTVGHVAHHDEEDA